MLIAPVLEGHIGGSIPAPAHGEAFPQLRVPLPLLRPAAGLALSWEIGPGALPLANIPRAPNLHQSHQASVVQGLLHPNVARCSSRQILDDIEHSVWVVYAQAIWQPRLANNRGSS